MIKKLNPVSKELILGILICGVIFQFSLIWLSDSKVLYTTGLWIGIAISVFLAVHMNWSIENAVEMDEKGAVSHMKKMFMLRALVVVVIFFGTYLLKIGDVVAVFLGLFGLKIGAYLQPLLHFLIQKIKKKTYSKGR